MIVINRKFNNSNACADLHELFMDWALRRLPDEGYSGFGCKPNTVFPSEHWVTPTEWETLNKLYNQITGNTCDAHTVTIRVGTIWRLVMTASVYDLQSFGGVFELFVEIDDEYLAVECKLAIS